MLFRDRGWRQASRLVSRDSCGDFRRPDIGKVQEMHGSKVSDISPSGAIAAHSIKPGLAYIAHDASRLPSPDRC
jgi:hypothetical protein